MDSGERETEEAMEKEGKEAEGKGEMHSHAAFLCFR